MSSRRVARPYGMKLTLTQFRWRGSGSILAACQTVDVAGVPYVRSSLPAGTLLIVERGFVILRVAPPRTNHSIITCDAGPRSARHARRSLGRWTSCGATASSPAGSYVPAARLARLRRVGNPALAGAKRRRGPAAVNCDRDHRVTETRGLRSSGLRRKATVWT